MLKVFARISKKFNELFEKNVLFKQKNIKSKYGKIGYYVKLVE